MYGRAKFDLLQIRLIRATRSTAAPKLRQSPKVPTEFVTEAGYSG